MAMETLILAANPGSSSRKYALYNQQTCIASLNFEHAEDERIVCTVISHGRKEVFDPKIAHLDDATTQVLPILNRLGIVKSKAISGIGLRVVAPSGYFLNDHILNDEIIDRLRQLEPRAPLHISVTLREIERLKKHYQNIPICLISDSAFHRTKPDYAWNYGLPLEDADSLEIKRFGYHGISMESVVEKLAAQKKLPAKLIICHLGSGSSVAAVVNGVAVQLI
jgi:acetate kinase